MIKIMLDILFPHRCLECDNIIDKEALVCGQCWAKINFTHWDFGDNVLKQKCEFLFPIERAFALMHYEKQGVSSKIIHQLKYNHQEKVGLVLADWVVERLNWENEKPDLLINVPLHPKKLKERGYNQLHLFTKALSEKWNIPYLYDGVKRNTYQKAQATKDKVHRDLAQYDFTLTQEIENQHILLIDDVFTTGNTISALAWEILKNRTNKVSILVMAVER